MRMDKVIDSIALNAERNAKHNEDDYTLGGILYCGKCGTPKQTKVNFLGNEKTVYCLCKCEQERLKKEEEEIKKQEKLRRIAHLRANGIHDENIRNWTFENADNTNPDAINKAKRYYQKWAEMHEKNIGLLLFGNVGTGKTYFAACVANALINDGVPVLMTNFSKILNDLSSFKEADKNSYVNSLNNYELLIIDDLGVERQSDYALEQVFNIIDSRYKNGQPLIVTTNLSIEDLRNPQDMKFKRIYDRILEMTIPIKIDGVSRREQLHKDKLEVAKSLFAD